MAPKDDFKLTANIYRREFAVSHSHPQLVEPVPGWMGPMIVRQAVFVLQPIRDWAGRALTTLSGYRSMALNVAVGGSETSQHCRAEATDWTMKNVQQVFEALLSAELELAAEHVGQVIFYPDQNFVHSALPSVRYPTPTFCLHLPAKGYYYQPLKSVDQMRRMIGAK